MQAAGAKVLTTMEAAPNLPSFCSSHRDEHVPTFGGECVLERVVEHLLRDCVDWARADADGGAGYFFAALECT